MKVAHVSCQTWVDGSELPDVANQVTGDVVGVTYGARDGNDGAWDGNDGTWDGNELEI